MAEFADREHYIPLRKTDLIQLLGRTKHLPIEERQAFHHFCEVVTAIYHFEYLQRLEDLKDTYAPFDPDSETKPLTPPSPEERQKKQDQLFDKFIGLMDRANFKHLKWADVQAAMEGGSSEGGLNMYVDPKMYERIEIFARGEVESVRTPALLAELVRKEEIKVPSYQRLIFIVKFRKHKNLGKQANLNAVFLKIFKDIPRLDMETLLPGARLEWPKSKLLTFWGLLVANVGYLLLNLAPKLVLVLYAVASGFAALSGKFSEAWETLTKPEVLGPVAIVGGFSYRQYAAYKTTQQNYHLLITESLYYQNLDNNAGVLTRLLDEAEEQECREVLLGYFCLWRFAPAQGWNSAQLDDYVEMFLEGEANLKVDFEIGDALDKLEKLRLVVKTGDRYRAVSLTQAIGALEAHGCQLMKS